MAGLTATLDAVDGAIAELGLGDSAVCVHASMRSFEPRVDADDLIERFLAAGSTVMVPTFTYEFSRPPPADDRPERNGTSYDANATAATDDGAQESDFEVAANDLSLADMGQFPRALLARPERVRGRHPLNSFAAVGPAASELIAGQSPDDVYAPLDALAAAGGTVLLIGVTYTSMTLLHLAEMRSGRRPFRRWAHLDGELVAASVGSCSAGFRKFEPVLDPIARMTTVGGSRWRALPALDALMTATGVIHQDPPMTHCENPECERCPDAIAGGPLL